jgi:lysophospholipase L1-like esterase
MTYFIIVFIGLILILGVVELCARIYYRLKFLIPFKSRFIEEYPYGQFIKKLDPPLEYRFKKGFRSKLVNINRFRCRGPEPAPDNTKKRLMLIGESIFFGVKLRHENQVWSARLEKILAERGFENWEVINAGNPTYNSYQHRLLWDQDLSKAKPDILLIEIGSNDVSQAWMMGSKWKPGTPWPWKFIMALERKSPWWNKLLSRFCLYFFFRRNTTERKKFPREDDNIQWEHCLDFIEKNYKAIIQSAQKQGIKVALVGFCFAYDLKITKNQARSLEAIQANWQSFIKGRAEYDHGLTESVKQICKKFNIPYIGLDTAFRNHPQRYRLYLDLAHYNSQGMEFVAETLYNNMIKYGWLDQNTK